jgi:AcrR family transcriptional regulator
MSAGMTRSTPARHRPTEADSPVRIRRALVEACNRELAHHGYGDLELEGLAREAGCSLEAVRDLLATKEELALAAVEWAEKSWYDTLGYLFAREADPVGALLAVARGHAVYSRDHVFPVMTTLSAEFEGSDHPVGRAVNEVLERFVDNTIRLINAGRRNGTIPPGPPPRQLSLAYLGALSWVVNNLSGHAPFDALLAERAVAGVLGVAPSGPSEHRSRIRPV